MSTEPVRRPRHATRLALAALTAATVVGMSAAGTPARADDTPVPSPAGTPTSAAAATLGSIVYVKNYNVWIARGDGSGQRQVTHDGARGNGYFSPSESDAGTIAAAHGSLIVRLSHTGGC